LLGFGTKKKESQANIKPEKQNLQSRSFSVGTSHSIFSFSGTIMQWQSG